MIEKLSNIIPELTKKEHELTVKEKEALYDALLKTADFMRRARIIPYLDNLITWFLTFCYLERQGIKKPSPETLFRAYDLIPKEIANINKLKQAIETPKILRMMKIKISKIIDEVESILRETEEKLKKVITKISGKEKLELHEIEEIRSILLEAQTKITEKLKLILERLETLAPEIETEADETPIFCLSFKLFQNILRRAITRKKEVKTPYVLVGIKIKNYYTDLKENLDKANLLDFLNKFSGILKGELRTQDLISFNDGVFYILLSNIELKNAINVVNRLLDTLKALIPDPKFELGIAMVEIHEDDELSSLLSRLVKVIAITDTLDGDVMRTELDLNVWR